MPISHELLTYQLSDRCKLVIVARYDNKCTLVLISVFLVVWLILYELCNLLQVKAHALYGNKEKAKDPFFGLTMGKSSQSSDDVFR
jgi:hypothetical protein